MNSGILRDDIRDATCDLQQSPAVIAVAHQRYRFTLKAAYFSIGQDRFQTITDFNTGAPIPNGVQNENSPICCFAAYTPFLEEVDRITLNIGAIEGVDRDHGNLGMGPLLDLAADVIHLRDRILVKNMREIVDVVGCPQLRDRLCRHGYDQRQNKDCNQTQSCQRTHVRIVQDAERTAAWRIVDFGF